MRAMATNATCFIDVKSTFDAADLRDARMRVGAGHRLYLAAYLLM